MVQRNRSGQAWEHKDTCEPWCEMSTTARTYLYILGGDALLGTTAHARGGECVRTIRRLYVVHKAKRRRERSVGAACGAATEHQLEHSRYKREILASVLRVHDATADAGNRDGQQTRVDRRACHVDCNAGN